MRCPDCSHVFDAVFGKTICPQCRSAYRVAKNGVSTWIQRDRQALAQFKATRKVDRETAPIIINGQLLCVCCADAFPASEMSDGRIDLDSERRVSVQVGWEHVESTDTLQPVYESRKLPRKIRGLICNGCMVRHNGKLVQTTDDRLRAAERKPFEKVYPGKGAREGYGFPTFAPGIIEAYTRPEDDESGLHMVPLSERVWNEDKQAFENDRDWLDQDPTWAHTGDPSWLSTRALPNVRYPRDRIGYWIRDTKLRAKYDAAVVAGEIVTIDATTPRINGSMRGWTYRPAKVFARQSQPGMVERITELVDPVKQIDTAIREARIPLAPPMPTRAYLDSLTAKALPHYASIEGPIVAHVYNGMARCYHGLTPETCSHCSKPDYTPGDVQDAIVTGPNALPPDERKPSRPQVQVRTWITGYRPVPRRLALEIWR